MRTPPRPGILLVATRELRWMRRDGVALFLALGVPIIAFTILAAIFSNAVVRNLKVTIVDADRSPTSLIYVQAIASAPGVSVAERSSDMTSAMHAIRSGDAIAAVYIPEHFERDLVAGRRPQIVSFYNQTVFHPRQQRLVRDIQRDRGGDRGAAAHIEQSSRLCAGAAGRGAIRSDQSGAELRAVPPARDIAHGSSRRHRHRGRICGRLGVLTAQPASLAQSGGRQSAHRPRWKALAAVRHLHLDDGRRRRHHSWALRRSLSRRLRADGGRGLPSGHRLSRARKPLAAPDPRACDRPEPHRHLLQSCLRLCGRGLSVAGHGRFRALLGSAAAAALVHPDPVRPGGARIAGVELRASRSSSSARLPPCSSGSPGCASAPSRGLRRGAAPSRRRLLPSRAPASGTRCSRKCVASSTTAASSA